MRSPTSILSGGDHRLVGAVGTRSPDQHDDVFEDQECGIGDENDHHLVLAVNQPQHAALEHEAEHEPDRHRHQHHEQETARVRPAALDIDAHRRGRAICAEGVERAVGDVEDLHHPEDQAQADGDEKQIGGIDEAIGEDGKDSQHVAPTVFTMLSARGPPSGGAPSLQRRREHTVRVARKRTDIASSRCVHRRAICANCTSRPSSHP